jgi:hypothetical protein
MVLRIRYRERACEPVPVPAQEAAAGPAAAEARRGALSEALDALGRVACADVPADPSVVLAGVRRSDDGAIVVDPRPRQVAATNRALLQLIACLAALIDQGRGDQPAPKRSRRATA